MTPLVKMAVGLSSGSVVHGALTGDWLLAAAAIAATAGLATVGGFVRQVVR